MNSLVGKDHLRNKLLEKAAEFNTTCQQIDRSLKKLGQTLQFLEHKKQLTSVFLALMDSIEAFTQKGDRDEIGGMAKECRMIVGPWLFRSPYFWRSYYKPHGYAGDYRIIEWTYDLENNPCEDPSEPGIVNCLNHLFKNIPCVQNIWDRRHWLSQLLADEYCRRNGQLRILDIACGGARYLKDFFSNTKDLSKVELTLVDQDPVPLAFCKTESLRPWLDKVKMVQTPITHLHTEIPTGKFDIVISAGLFDYVDDWLAKKLIKHMVSLTAPGGVVGMTNFHPKDSSRLVREWLVDWCLIFRDEKEVTNLFSEPNLVQVSRSENHGLVLATSRKEGGMSLH